MTAIDGRIDLHGMTQRSAHGRLLSFLDQARSHGSRVVLVITGKGVRTPDAPGSHRETGVLRRAVPLWLEEPAFRALVAGYSPAHRSHGGDGALYVRLRRRRGA
ncbi:MAG: Smr/MutS family protein [Pseudomonadota bacterium]